MNKRKLLKKLLASPANARFDDVRDRAETVGFRLRWERSSGIMECNPKARRERTAWRSRFSQG
jgi:hypothetical protein